jgi:CheY-like chemotaxis protein
MSGMSGLELLPKAKAVRPDVPIIMITAYGDPETKRQAFENGAEALLTKPIDSRRCAVRSTAAPRAPVCTENPIRIFRVTESAKLAR